MPAGGRSAGSITTSRFSPRRTRHDGCSGAASRERPESAPGPRTASPGGETTATITALPGGGWVQVATDADRAGASNLTLVVDDLAEELGRLSLHGLTPVAKAMGDFFKTAKFRDPDGNQIVFSQPQHGTY